MNSIPPTQSDISPPQQLKKVFAFQAAKGCLASSIIVLFFLMFGMQVAPRVIMELTVLVFLLLGMGLGITALFGIPKHGPRKILVPTLAGMIINGFLIFISITNFTAARNKALSQKIIPIDDSKITATATSQKLFQNGKISFQYDGQYQIKNIGQKGQIVLQHPYSNVLFTEFGKKLEVEDSLRKFATAIKADLQQQNYANIAENSFEKVELPKVSAGRIKLEYTRPEGRIVADLYILSNETNACSIAHYYPKNRSVDASRLFGTVLNSFSFQ